MELRSLGGAGVGRYLKQTNHWILKAKGGMDLGRERFREDESRVNVEGLAALQLDYFMSRPVSVGRVGPLRLEDPAGVW